MYYVYNLFHYLICCTMHGAISFFSFCISLFSLQIFLLSQFSVILIHVCVHYVYNLFHYLICCTMHGAISFFSFCISLLVTDLSSLSVLSYSHPCVCALRVQPETNLNNFFFVILYYIIVTGSGKIQHFA